MKIESLTRYMLENFEAVKRLRNEELSKATGDMDKEDKPETNWEFSDKNGKIKVGFWANNLVQTTFRSVATKFENMPIFIREFQKNFVVNNSVVRFFWTSYDIREYFESDENAYTPYMSIGGTFFVEEMKYPERSLERGNWIVRELIEEQYKHGEGKDGSFTKNVKMRYKITLPKHIYMKDIKEVKVGLYDQETGKWKLEPTDIVLKDETIEKGKIKYTNKVVEFYSVELGIIGILIDRNINFPYKAWNLRCIRHPKIKDELVAVLDLITPRTKFVFEIGLSDPNSSTEGANRYYPTKAYMKLIDNKEKEFEHLADKELTFDQMIIALKDCGILIAPWKEDIDNVGIREKNYQVVNRAVEDIVMCCRYYSIRSHEYNKLIDTNQIAVKGKPNPEFDKYPYDDEEKDWSDICWYVNKVSIGEFVVENEKDIVFHKKIETTRPNLHLILKDIKEQDIYDQVSEDYFSSAFLVNIRNVIRVLNLVNVP